MQKNTSFMSIEDRKKNVEEYKDEPEQEKLAPWEDYPSRLSSMFLKKKWFYNIWFQYAKNEKFDESYIMELRYLDKEEKFSGK